MSDGGGSISAPPTSSSSIVPAPRECPPLCDTGRDSSGARGGLEPARPSAIRCGMGGICSGPQGAPGKGGGPAIIPAGPIPTPACIIEKGDMPMKPQGLCTCAAVSG